MAKQESKEHLSADTAPALKGGLIEEKVLYKHVRHIELNCGREKTMRARGDQ